MDQDEKNCYYLAISALQKCVRRGWADLAVKMGNVAWRLDKWRLFRRLFTVMFEEAGGDIEMMQVIAQWKGTYKDFSTLEPLIRQAVSSTLRVQYKCII